MRNTERISHKRVIKRVRGLRITMKTDDIRKKRLTHSAPKTEEEELAKQITNLRHVFRNQRKYCPSFKEISPHIEYRFSLSRRSQVVKVVSASQLTRDKDGRVPVVCPRCDSYVYAFPQDTRHKMKCSICKEISMFEPVTHRNRHIIRREESINILWWETSKLYARVMEYVKDGDDAIIRNDHKKSIHIRDPRKWYTRHAYNKIKTDMDCVYLIDKITMMVEELFPYKEGLLSKLDLVRSYLLDNSCLDDMKLSIVNNLEKGTQMKPIELPNGISLRVEANHK